MQNYASCSHIKKSLSTNYFNYRYWLKCMLNALTHALRKCLTSVKQKEFIQGHKWICL